MPRLAVAKEKRVGPSCHIMHLWMLCGLHAYSRFVPHAFHSFPFPPPLPHASEDPYYVSTQSSLICLLPPLSANRRSSMLGFNMSNGNALSYFHYFFPVPVLDPPPFFLSLFLSVFSCPSIPKVLIACLISLFPRRMVVVSAGLNGSHHPIAPGSEC